MSCTFSTSQFPKVLQRWCALYILTWKCASRHNGVHLFHITTSKSAPNLWSFNILTCKCALRHNGMQFFISHLPRWLRTHRFSEPTFRPSGATNHWKNTVKRVRRNHGIMCDLVTTARKCGTMLRYLKSFHGYTEPSHRESRLFYLFPHLHLLSSDSFSSLIFSSSLL